MPALVTVNVESRNSSPCSVPARAPSTASPDLGVDLGEREAVAAADDRYDEPGVRLHGDAEVVALEQHDLVAVDACVELREHTQRLGDRLQRRGNEKLPVDAGEVAFLDERDGGNLTVRALDLLDDRAPDPADRDAPARVRGERPGSMNVTLRDAPRRSAAADGEQVDPELPGKTTHAGRCACGLERLVAHDDERAGSRWLLRRERSHRAQQVLTLLAEDDQGRAHGRDPALGDEDHQHGAGIRRRDLDRRLVRLDLDERIALGDHISLSHEPAGDLALGEALPEPRQLELVRHAGRW